jgi:hypothetical protein
LPEPIFAQAEMGADFSLAYCDCGLTFKGLDRASNLLNSQVSAPTGCHSLKEDHGRNAWVTSVVSVLEAAKHDRARRRPARGRLKMPLQISAECPDRLAEFIAGFVCAWHDVEHLGACFAVFLNAFDASGDRTYESQRIQ